MGMAHNGPFSLGCFQKHGTLSLYSKASATLGTSNITGTHKMIKENTSFKQDARKIQLFPPGYSGPSVFAEGWLQGQACVCVCVCVCIHTHISVYKYACNICVYKYHMK